MTFQGSNDPLRVSFDADLTFNLYPEPERHLGICVLSWPDAVNKTVPLPLQRCRARRLAVTACT